MKKVIGILGVAAAMVAGCENMNQGQMGSTDNQMHDTVSSGQRVSQDKSSAGTPADGTAATMMDKRFFTNAGIGGQFEVKSSKLALQKSSDEGVKRVAQMMIDDHTKVNDRLTALAGRKGGQVPADLDTPHQQMLDQLSQLNGTQFDQAYLQQQQQAHNEAISLYQTASTSADDPEVRRFAADTLPQLQQHLTMIKDSGSRMSMEK